MFPSVRRGLPERIAVTRHGGIGYGLAMSCGGAGNFRNAEATHWCSAAYWLAGGLRADRSARRARYARQTGLLAGRLRWRTPTNHGGHPLGVGIIAAAIVEFGSPHPAINTFPASAVAIERQFAGVVAFGADAVLRNSFRYGHFCAGFANLAKPLYSVDVASAYTKIGFRTIAVELGFVDWLFGDGYRANRADAGRGARFAIGSYARSNRECCVI